MLKRALHRWLVLLLVVLSACSAPVVPQVGDTASAPAPASSAVTSPPGVSPAPASDTPRPVSTSTGTPLPTATRIPSATLAADLSTRAAGLLTPPPPTGTPAGYGGIDGVQAVPLTGTLLGEDYWMAFSTGMVDYGTQQRHFVAVYRRAGDAWQEVARTQEDMPDYLCAQCVRQVPIEPGHIWITVDGGVGAHGGVFTLLRFDGKTLAADLTNSWENPYAGAVTDVNGDGMLDVLLNHTVSYVFCYACGVRYVDYSVYSLEDTRWVTRTIELLPDSVPADLREPVNRAVTLARAGLLKDAQAAAEEARGLRPTDPDAVWDISLVLLVAQSQQEYANSGAYPLLDKVLYGDYPAALDVLRPYSAEQIFDSSGPLLAGTSAEGWESELGWWITSTTSLAIGAEPNLAAAYYLRGWAEQLTRPGNPAALADVERAAQLDPLESLYPESVTYLKRH